MIFQLANQQHEKDLRELLLGSAMPGWVHAVYGRDPDFFQAVSVQGKENQVLIALEQGRIVGMGSRSIKSLMVNGERMDFGYLGGLRLHPQVRRTGLLARGYVALKRLHEERPVPAYLTTVIEDNAAARNLLTSGRAGLPDYIDQGRYMTYAISLTARSRKFLFPFDIHRGDAIGLRPILSFLAQTGGQRQFFPALDADNFNTDYLRGLSPADFRVAVNDQGEIIGAAAVWDQTKFKQVIIQDYAKPIRFFRPILSTLLRLGGYGALPPVGQRLDSLYIAFPCVRGGDPLILRALLERIHVEHRRRGHHSLLLGLHEQDPLTAAVDHFQKFKYVSRMYLVCWEDGLDFVKNLDPAKVPHLELATL